MRMEFLEADSLKEVPVVDDALRMERISFTMAACMLMANNASLSPQDAVGDVLQVYQFVTDALPSNESPGKEES